MSAAQVLRMHVTPELAGGTEMIMGNLNKDGQLVGSSYKAVRNAPKQGIPNSYMAYVKKHIDEGTKKYEGKFDFVDANTPGAEQIEIRYLANAPSLDAKFQEDRLYAPKSTEYDSTFAVPPYFEYPGGQIVEFKYSKTNPLFIQFILNAPFNGSKKDRDSNVRALYIISDGEKNVDKKKAVFETEKKLFAVKSGLMDSDDLVDVFSEIFDIKATIYEVHTRRDMLLDKLALDGEKFISKMENAKTKIENRAEYLFKEGLVTISANKIVSQETKKPVHPKKFSSDKPSEVVEELSAYSMSTAKAYLEWKEFEKSLLQPA